MTYGLVRAHFGLLALTGSVLATGCGDRPSELPPPPQPTAATSGAVLDAIRDQLVLIDQQPQSIDLRAQLARLYQANNQLGPAQMTWNQVLAAAPDRAEFWYTAALAHHDAGDYSRAVEAAARSRELDPTRSMTWWRPAFWQLDLGRPELAERLARESIRLAPDDPGGHVALALTLLELDQPEGAVDVLRRLQAKTNHPHVRYLLGQALQRSGQQATAEVLLDAGSPTRPAFPDPWHRKVIDARRGLDASLERMDRMLEENRITEAMAEAQAALERWPDNVNVLHRRSECHRRRGHGGRWLLDLKEALRIEPENAITHLNLSVAYSAQGQSAQAMSHAREAVTWNANIPEAHLHLARLLIARDKIDEAAETLDLAFDLGVQDPRERMQYAHVLLRAGRLPEAEHHAVRVTMVTPDDPLAWGVLAEVLYSRNRLSDAMEALRIGLQNAPGHAGLIGLRNSFQNPSSRPEFGP